MEKGSDSKNERPPPKQLLLSVKMELHCILKWCHNKSPTLEEISLSEIRKITNPQSQSSFILAKVILYLAVIVTVMSVFGTYGHMDKSKCVS